MLFFTVLMLTLGVKAQSSSDYFDFPSEVIKMTKLTSANQLKDGMQIVIQHNHENHATATNHGKYFIINSSVASGSSYHTTALNSFCSGLAIFRLEGSVEQGFKLKTIHSETDGVTCYVGRFGYANLTTSALYPAVVMFEYNAEKGFRLTSMTEKGYSYCLCVDGEGDDANITTDSSERSTSDDFINRTSFNVYKVEETFGTTHYVKDAKVSLVGPAGNAIETTHTGWSDFYEFVTNDGGHYGCTLLNTKYYSETNEIIAGIQYPFAISGDVAKVPVHLCPIGSGGDFEPRQEPSRISIVDGQLTIVQKPDGGWVKDERNQWYIFPKYENMAITYAIQNVKTKQYISHTSNDKTISLSDTPAYFTLSANSVKTRLRFGFDITYNNGVKYTYLLYNNASSLAAGDMGWSPSSNFLVSTVSGDELEGVEADGFVRRYHNDAFFWDGGQVDLHRAPYAMKALFESAYHEDYANGEHQLYTAETGIKVTKMDNVEVTFHTYGGSDNMLLVCGVDVVNLAGVVVASDYHLGKAGYDNQAQTEVNDLNVYTLPNVPMGDYTLRYWVCNRVDDSVDHGHSLLKNKGWIDVTGANYRIVFSHPLVDGKFAANTTWFRMRLHDELQRYISAQPAYMENDKKLKLTNNTPPNDNAGLWAIVGNATDGYKFYNRAWGPDYALTTTGYQDGDGGSARTYLVPVAEASVYDIVQVPGSYKFSVKLRVGDTDNAYFKYRDGYLGIWDDVDALGEENSIMTFETVLMEGWEERSNALMNDIKKRWRPWIAEPEIGIAYDYVIRDADFAFMMKERLAAFIGLDGKVFKFANIDTYSSNRTGKLLAVNGEGKVAGIAPTNTIQDYLQLYHNGDGTFMLYHPYSGKYLKTPDGAETTDNPEEAAHFTYDMYGDEEGVVAFATGGQMIHLSKDNLLIMDYNDLADAASRWEVSYSQEAQDLVNLLQNEVKAKVAETAADEYQANCGVPGYASAATVAALNSSITAALAATDLAAAKTMLEAALKAIADEETAPLFPTDCYFTVTNTRGSIIYDPASETKDTKNGNADYIWHGTASKDDDDKNDLWGFYHNVATGDYYLYNVGSGQFASYNGSGTYSGQTQGKTWILSDIPVPISLTDLTNKKFHIKSGNKSMSISTGFYGSVIEYGTDDPGDEGVPFKFEKSTSEFDEELLAELEEKVRAAGLLCVKDLAKLENTAVYVVYCNRGPLAYVDTKTNLSTPIHGLKDYTYLDPKYDVADSKQQLAILRTENTPEGWYYLYSIGNNKFVKEDLTYSDDPVSAVNFRSLNYNNYNWEVWFGHQDGAIKQDKKLNMNWGAGLKFENGATTDEGNVFRIEFAEANAERTADAVAKIIALETAKADAKKFLDETPQTVGYPKEEARTAFADVFNAFVTSVNEIEEAKETFVTSSNIVMPEDGKAYKISAWWRNRTWPLTFIEEGEGSYACKKPAYAPVENAEAAVFVCRDLGNGEYAFVTNNGYYLGWQSDTKANKTAMDFTVGGVKNAFKVSKSVANANGDNLLGVAELFGTVNLCGHHDNNNSWWHYMFSSSTTEFHDAGAGATYYGDNAHTIYYKFEEVTAYTLNTIKMNALTDNDHQLLTGLETGMSMSTFSAPYPTVTPEGITAYYAEQFPEGDNTVVTLKKMRTAIPANQGVVLVGEVGVSGNFKMRPAAGEDVPAELNNRLSATGDQSVVMSQSGVDYILGKGSKGAGFYKAKAGSTLAAGKAYFHFENAGQVRNFVLRFGGETTDIEDAVLAPATDNDAIYDLSGRRVNEVTKGGIYIKNGKKFIVK